jgi:hypothetical protein
MNNNKIFFSKKLVILTISFIFLLLLTSSFTVCSHSPSSMMLTYSKITKQLTVDITHQVSDPNNHYVENIVVKINGETNFSKDYTSQAASSFTYTYEEVEVAEGDIIEVTATCNIGGSITKELTVDLSDVSATGGDSSTPGFEITLALFAIIALLIIIRKKDN